MALSGRNEILLARYQVFEIPHRLPGSAHKKEEGIPVYGFVPNGFTNNLVLTVFQSYSGAQ